jgi:hypothetical protein
MEIDLEQARRFLKVLDPGADSRELLEGIPDGFTFQTFDDNKERKDRSLARTLPGTLDAVLPELKSYASRGAGVFVNINETDNIARRKGNITRVRAIWAELDDGEPKPFPLEPHLVCQTSPGKCHKIFLVNGLTFEQHRSLEELLIAEYGSDKDAKDLCRVLRVPGFYHQKGEPHMVQLIHESGAAPYSAAEILEAFKDDLSAREGSHSRTSVSSTTGARLAKNVPDDGYSPLEDSDAQPTLPDITLENCRKYLPEPGNQSREEWLAVLKAFHHQFDGAHEALLIIDEWSQQVRSYNGFDDVEYTWNSFNRGYAGAVTTFRSLVQEYNKKLVKTHVAKGASAYSLAQQLLDNCDDHIELTGVVAPKLWKLANGVVSIEKDFCRDLIARYATLRGGEILTRQEATRAMRSKRKAAEDADEPILGFRNPKSPEWTNDWVWISTTEAFYNTQTSVTLTTKGFSSHYDSRLPKGEGAPTNASAYARDNYFVPKVMRSFYLPGADLIFVHDGVSCVNTYSDNYRCYVPAAIENPEAVAIFKRHIELIFGGWNRESQLFCNFLTACISAPPRKVRWAVVLIGQFGDGKSLFRTFLAHALGLRNVRSIRGNTIAKSADTSFNGWVEGHCLGFVEEIKWHGHNRYEIINSIKDVITEGVIESHRKGENPDNVYNAANYFLTSNYLDSVPVETGDRRYFMVQSKFPLSTILREEPEYFTEGLAKAINDAPGDLVCWLRNIPTHADFDPDKPAPMTETKMLAIGATKDEIDSFVLEMIEEDDDPLLAGNVICFNHLFSKLMILMEGALKSDQQFKLNKALSNLHFVKLGRGRIDGGRDTLWVKRVDGNILSLDDASELIRNRITAYELGGVGIV